jgi:prefoldin subunit 5
MTDSEFRRLCSQLNAFRNQRDSLTQQIAAMEAHIEAEKTRRAALSDHERSKYAVHQPYNCDSIGS